MGPTSFVDFCNRDVSRARPRFVRAPLHRAHGRPRAQLLPDLARRSRDARAPRVRVAEPLVRRRALARRREDPLLERACLRTLARGGESRMPASRDVTGQGPYMNPRERKLPAPSVAIARAGSFAPTRSARAPPVASSMLPAVESVRGAGALSAPSVSEFELTGWRGRLRDLPPLRAASHDPPRRRSCSAAPEVLSVVRSAPLWEPWPGPQPVPRLWSPGRRLCDPRAGLDP